MVPPYTCSGVSLSHQGLPLVHCSAQPEPFLSWRVIHAKALVPGLLTGTVDGVVISGKDWASRLNLTCSTLRFKVGSVAIDPGALVTERLVKLRSVPTG